MSYHEQNKVLLVEGRGNFPSLTSASLISTHIPSPIHSIVVSLNPSEQLGEIGGRQCMGGSGKVVLAPFMELWITIFKI